MKQIAVLATNSSISSDVLGLLDFFEYCNVLWRYQHGEHSAALFHCYLVSPDGKPLTLKQGVTLAVQRHNWQQADAIILPAAYAYSRAQLTALAQQSAGYFSGLPHEHEIPNDCPHRQISESRCRRVGVFDRPLPA